MQTILQADSGDGNAAPPPLTDGQSDRPLSRFVRRIEERSRTPSLGPVIIVALGDSVTQGCMEAGVIDPENVYHNVFKKRLERKYPDTPFHVINAGVGGESAAGGRTRLERDVIAHAPDLLLLGYCLNDACGGRGLLPEYCANITAIIESVRARLPTDIIVLTPNFMATRENPAIAEEHKPFARTIIDTQNNGTLKAYAMALQETAAARKVPVADVYGEWEHMAAEGVDTTALLCNGLNHPDVPSHRLIAKTILALLDERKD